MRTIEELEIDDGMGGACDTGPGYLQLPKEMAIYTQPQLPDDPGLRAAARFWLERLHTAMADYRVGAPSPCFDLRDINADERRFIDDLSGRGEVNAAIVGGRQELQVYETAFPGLWRIYGWLSDADGVVDRLEVAGIPDLLRDRARAACEPLSLPAKETLSPELVNSPHIVAELISRSRAFEADGSTHTVNLDLLPMSEADLGWLVQTLGEGPVVILSSGYGACRIRSTRLAGTWWVQYFNSSDSLILNSLEVVGVPAVACAADDDIAESAQRLLSMQDVLG